MHHRGFVQYRIDLSVGLVGQFRWLPRAPSEFAPIFAYPRNDGEQKSDGIEVTRWGVK
jgi:hypothetical protein